MCACVCVRVCVHGTRVCVASDGEESAEILAALCLLVGTLAQNEDEAAYQLRQANAIHALGGARLIA
eukprot:COSAG05_NODE_7926_length_755_cov_0.620427_2_plen_67_part_00